MVTLNTDSHFTVSEPSDSITLTATPSLNTVNAAGLLREIEQSPVARSVVAGLLATLAASFTAGLQPNNPLNGAVENAIGSATAGIESVRKVISPLIVDSTLGLYEALAADADRDFSIEIASDGRPVYHVYSASDVSPESYLEKQQMDPGLLILGGIGAALALGFYLSHRARKSRPTPPAGGDSGQFFSSSRQSAANPYADLGMHRGEKPDRPDERFEDIGGLDHVVEELRELKDDIESVINGDYDVHLPRGILMHGPPGVGKTLLARAIAGELNVPFIHFDSSQFTQMLKGTGPARVRTGFEAGRAERDQMTRQLRLADGSIEDPPNTITFPNPYGRVYDKRDEANPEEDEATQELRQGVCILFYDEFESIGSKRDMNEGISDDERRNVVNSLLNEMDGLNKEKNRNIIVIAATNFMSDIDGALLRPGRFTKKIYVPLPASSAQRLDVINKLVPHIVEKRNKTIESKEALNHLAVITSGKSPDELRGVLEEAVAMSRRARRDVITQEDLIEAFQRLSYGRLRTNYLPREKHELVAHHEHGHALAAIATGIKIFLVSMEPRDQSAGRVVIDPEGFAETLATRRDMLMRILLGAGGRAAELAEYGEGGITAGASSDLDQIRGLIAHMVSNGMIDQHYTLKIDRMAQHQWPEVFIELTNRVTDRALDAAKQIVEAVGQDQMQSLVYDSLDLNGELIGEEAHRFYAERLSPEVIERIEQIASKFLDNPLGNYEESPDSEDDKSSN